MCLHMLHNPLTLESGGFSIHQGSTSPPSFAADSNVASDVVIGKSAMRFPLLKRLLSSSILNFFFSTQKTISVFLSSSIIVKKLTIISLVFRWLLVSSLKIYTLGFPFPRLSGIPQVIDIDFISICE